MDIHLSHYELILLVLISSLIVLPPSTRKRPSVPADSSVVRPTVDHPFSYYRLQTLQPYHLFQSHISFTNEPSDTFTAPPVAPVAHPAVETPHFSPPTFNPVVTAATVPGINEIADFVVQKLLALPTLHCQV